MFRNLRFALNSAWQSFWRNLAVSLAAVLSITLILILGGVNLLIGHAFSQVLDGFREKVSVISINVADDTPLPTVYGFQQQLASDPRVAGVKYITKEQALANFTADPNNAVLAQQLQGNPLDAKLEVRVKALSDVASIDALARQWSGVDPTNPTNYQGDFVNRMLQLSQWLGYAGAGCVSPPQRDRGHEAGRCDRVVRARTVRDRRSHDRAHRRIHRACAARHRVPAGGTAVPQRHRVHPAFLRPRLHRQPGS
jgi:cell division protein FtsX